MKVLFIVSECVPFSKTGGLADVAGSLPSELKRLGTDIRIILPKYQAIPDHFKKQMSKICEFTVSVGWRQQYCGIEQLDHEGITYYFVDNEYYFNREGYYGYFDDGERFSFFTKAVLESMNHISFYPNVLHCHDWHTAMVPFLLRTEYQKRPGYHFIRTVFTIHNLKFQGIFPKSVMTELLEIPEHYFTPERLEFYGNINFMKAGLISADSLTTVSPTYRNEILTPYYGEQMDGILKSRENELVGILNGIDEDQYNAARDSNHHSFSANNLSGKAMIKKELQRRLGLVEDEKKPIISLISRLTKQKGLDLVTRVFHEMLQEDVQFILLGTGDWEFEQFFRHEGGKYPDKVRAIIGFDEALAKEIYAGSDLFIMPSQFEPCGLGQMIAMRYGTLPIVRETGGLNDTVHSYNEMTGTGNGFSFHNFNAHDMLYTIRRAIHLYHSEQNTWNQIVKQAMEMDFSWAQSAFQYNQLYAELASRSESHVF